LLDGKLHATFYYTKDKRIWSTWEAPIFDMLKGEEILPVQESAEEKE